MSFLTKGSAIVDALSHAIAVIYTGFVEVISGIVAWVAISVVGYVGVIWVISLTASYLSGIGVSMLTSNIMIVMQSLRAVYALAAVTAWVCFVYNVCKGIRA